MILPLVDLIVNAGADEKQLADKATGILRSRIGKSKDTVSPVDDEQVGEILRELHSRARKASTGDIVTTLAQSSLFLSKALLHAQISQPVLDIYRESLEDFVTRKASRLNTAFFQEFIRRHANVSWELRDTLLELSGKAVNGYRQSQVFQLIQVLLSQPTATVSIPPSFTLLMSKLTNIGVGRSRWGDSSVHVCLEPEHAEGHSGGMRD